MRAHFQHLVHQPIERVFPFLADPRNRPLWQASLRAVEMQSEGEPRVGTRWRERPAGLARFDMSIVALDPNRLWAERLEGRGVRGQISLRFTDEADVTRLDVDIELDLPKPVRLAAPLIRAGLVAAMRRDLSRVAKLI